MISIISVQCCSWYVFTIVLFADIHSSVRVWDRRYFHSWIILQCCEQVCMQTRHWRLHAENWRGSVITFVKLSVLRNFG